MQLYDFDQNYINLNPLKKTLVTINIITINNLNLIRCFGSQADIALLVIVHIDIFISFVINVRRLVALRADSPKTREVFNAAMNSSVIAPVNRSHLLSN